MALTIPNTITNGTAADGSELAANFSAIKSFVDTTQTDLDTAEASLVTAEADIDALEASTSADMTLTKFERTTDITLTNGTSSLVTWETETDPDGWWSSGSTITCPGDGVYALTIEMDLQSGDEVIAFFKNLTVSGGIFYAVGDVGDHTDGTLWRYSGGEVLYLRSGQTFEVKVSEQFNGGAVVENIILAIVKLADL